MFFLVSLTQESGVVKPHAMPRCKPRVNVVKFAKTQQRGDVASNAGDVHEVLVIVLSKMTFQRGFIHKPNVGLRHWLIQVFTMAVFILSFKCRKSTSDHGD